MNSYSERQNYLGLTKENGQSAFAWIPVFANLIFNRQARLRLGVLGTARFFSSFPFGSYILRAK